MLFMDFNGILRMKILVVLVQWYGSMLIMFVSKNF